MIPLEGRFVDIHHGKPRASGDDPRTLAETKGPLL